MKLEAYIVVAVAVLALLCGCLFFSQYTGLVAMNEAANQGWADIDAQLRSREDLIPDLVSAVRDRVPDGEDVFTAIADASGKLAGAASPAAKAEADEALTAALGRLLVIANGCPELNADERFIILRNELADTEKRIEVSRGSYNDIVEIYNLCIGEFPGSFIAGRIGHKPRETFEPPHGSAEASGEAGATNGTGAEKTGE